MGIGSRTVPIRSAMAVRAILLAELGFAADFNPVLRFIQPSANPSVPGLPSGNFRVTLRKSQGYAAKTMRCGSTSPVRTVRRKLMIQLGIAAIR